MGKSQLRQQQRAATAVAGKKRRRGKEEEGEEEEYVVEPTVAKRTKGKSTNGELKKKKGKKSKSESDRDPEEDDLGEKKKELTFEDLLDEGEEMPEAAEEDDGKLDEVEAELLGIPFEEDGDGDGDGDGDSDGDGDHAEQEPDEEELFNPSPQEKQKKPAAESTVKPVAESSKPAAKAKPPKQPKKNAKIVDESNVGSFADLGLDARLLKALTKLSFERPTLVQASAIPLALQGKDILAKARTGSGKTMAYCIPLIQKILTIKEALPFDDPARHAFRGLILVPTKELSEQVARALRDLCAYLTGAISYVNLIAADATPQSLAPILLEKPDIVVGTPARVLTHVTSGSVTLSETLETLVVDEADLILSYGHDEDLREILGHLPRIHQSLLMSATVSADVQELKQLILRNPAILKLEDEGTGEDLLTQYYLRCGENEKFLITFFLLKLKVFPFGTGKVIVFVNNTDRCYKLKLFLEQFGIRSCALNAEMPLKSRYHIVEEFNRGIYDIIIATDESSEVEEAARAEEVEEEEEKEEAAAEADEEDGADEDDGEEAAADDDGDDDGVEGAEEDGDNEDETEDAAEVAAKPQAKPSKALGKRGRGTGGRGRDVEYGVSRGVDFRQVQAVINFDLPRTAKSYMHRVGRTARGVGNKGWALSFVVPEDKAPAVIVPKGKKRSDIDPEKLPIGAEDEKVFERILKTQEGRELLEFVCDMVQVNAFKYRVDDAIKSITKTVVKEARLKEIKQEIINSEKLKAHFEDNPKDLQALRHDKPLHQARVQSHMRHVPDYLLPKKAITVSDSSRVGYVPFRTDSRRRGRGGKSFRGRGGGVKKSDPLKSFRKK
ncbi:ATP-dependent DNA/RNA helicase [Phlyctochytrium bullatum]|nr:ATP-dependent DNA/RNA helicase [Phlyctochytrium bullatum]